ncbi:MAG: hypothetical protein AAGI30_08265 [Planctomycetota bacterium]
MNLSPIACVAIAATAGGTHAQLVTSYTGDEGGLKNWIIDVTTGDAPEGPLGKSQALAADPTTGRLFEIEPRVLGSNTLRLRVSRVNTGGDLVTEGTVLLFDERGNTIRVITSLAYGNGQLYAFNTGSGASDTGLFVIDTGTGVLSPLPGSSSLPITPGGVLRGLTFDTDRGRLLVGERDGTSNDSVYSIHAFDPQTGESQLVVQGTPAFDGLAYGYGRIYTDCGAPCGPIGVFNTATGLFEDTLPLPERFGNGAGGAAFLPQLAASDPLPTAFERRVQIRSVDFEASIIELFNFSADDVALDGWRFCSHDFASARRYTAPGGFDGITIEAGTALFVHFDDDAPAGDVDRINRSALGGAFASPLDQDAYAMQLFFPDAVGNVSFGNSSLIADHLQWNIAGEPIGSAEARTAQAVSEGLWSAPGEFVPTFANSTLIELNDPSGDFPGSPDEYEVITPSDPEPTACPGDLDGDFDVDAADFVTVLVNFGRVCDQSE